MIIAMSGFNPFAAKNVIISILTAVLWNSPYFERAGPGVYVFEYDLRANNKGDFANGIATIQSMYAPEFSSHSEGTRILIE